MQLPMIIFTSCSLCKSCISFRGNDGKPKDGKPWNPGFIRNCLFNEITKTLKCLRIINIHDGDFGANVNNIREFNIYHLIPSDLIVTHDFFEKLMSDDNSYVGNSILTVSLIKGSDMSIIISVEIDGIQTDTRCEEIKTLVYDFFFWKHIPIEFETLRHHFYDVYNGKKTESLENIITNELREDNFYDLLIKEYYLYCKDPSKYEKIMKIRFNYNWFLDTFFPKRLRELEIMYPSWALILPSEWKKGLTSDDPVYSKIACCKSILSNNKFDTKRIGYEKIEDLIIQYHSGRLSLTYENVLLQPKKVRFSV